ncbi:protein FLUORESCENT IN BLUE LIGHT, chloroplastic-like [Phalaenopsis equestris]|uniref:protein FLUORESCENT IN BLUE LIGHT, chloroplastic-like n=1 Tax=Phalaenopsis equestris TaxID=78828 RepID=UPI0009E3D716|nr:protein FLUORESCENT IN BLUE LIGHT, chloroplastic-like [Phalaenopsis equestris]
MTGLIRCFHPPPRSRSGEISRWACLPSFEFSVGTRGSEKLALYFKRKKLDVFPIRVQFSSLKSQLLPSSDCLFFKKDTLLMFRSGRVQYNNILGFCHGITEAITYHKVLTSAKALVVVQVLMFILPPNVLAETCKTENSFFNMPFLFIIALIGATVGGLLARQRRGELKRLNDQLRQINAALRRQAKIESYAPKLSYAPVGRIAESEVVVDPKKEDLIKKLRLGKNYLRNHELERAFLEFKTALELSEALGDHVEEKKAARGLGASLQRQGKYKEAIKYHSKVLEIASKVGENSGITEAYGAIADCYTELGDLEKAGKFYDQYIARLEKD